MLHSHVSICSDHKWSLLHCVHCYYHRYSHCAYILFVMRRFTRVRNSDMNKTSVNLSGEFFTKVNISDWSLCSGNKRNNNRLYCSTLQKHIAHKSFWSMLVKIENGAVSNCVFETVFDRKCSAVGLTCEFAHGLAFKHIKNTS